MGKVEFITSLFSTLLLCLTLLKRWSVLLKCWSVLLVEIVLPGIPDFLFFSF